MKIRIEMFSFDEETVNVVVYNTYESNGSVRDAFSEFLVDSFVNADGVHEMFEVEEIDDEVENRMEVANTAVFVGSVLTAKDEGGTYTVSVVA